MPNLTPPVLTVDDALAYQKRIMEHVPDGESFTPLMTLYLTDQTQADSLKGAKSAGITACKLYPAHATTNADAGVTNIENLYPVFEAMQAEGLPLLIHGEMGDPAIDIFDREKRFVEEHLGLILAKFPQLKVVLEHITTKFSVEFVKQAPTHLAATITPHHLILDRNDLLAGGIKPHYYCLPILKRDTDKQALRKAAMSGHPKFFLGTDSAPHADNRKLSVCGCAGIYNSIVALPLLAGLFEEANCLDKLENFTSVFGAKFYGLPTNTETMELIKEPWNVPQSLIFGDGKLTPLLGGKHLNWHIV